MYLFLFGFCARLWQDFGFMERIGLLHADIFHVLYVLQGSVSLLLML